MAKSIKSKPKAPEGKSSKKPTADTGEVVAKVYAEAAAAAEKALKNKHKKKAGNKSKPAPTYRLAIITFIDILGFSDLVAKSDGPVKIRNILSRLASFAANRTNAKYEIDETAAVVLVCPHGVIRLEC